MSFVLARALLEMAMNDERARRRPDDRPVAGAKKKKLFLKDYFAGFGCPTSSASR